MRGKLFLKIILGIVIVSLLIKLLTIVLVEPWIKGKIQSSMNERNGEYFYEIDRVHINLISRVIKLDSISIYSEVPGADRDLAGKIASIKFKGVRVVKAIFRNDIYINTITISSCIVKSKISSSDKILPIVLPLKVSIDRIIFDKFNLELENDSTAQFFSVNEGALKLYDLAVEKKDTLSYSSVRQFDFEAEELISVSSDSMYSFAAREIAYSSAINRLAVTSLSVQPNYTNYDFTSRYKFQKLRFEADFNNIYFHDFYALDYFSSKSLKSSYIEIGKMEMKVFRDKRKAFRHVNMPAFQEMIYNYRGNIMIDSLALRDGDVTYTVHGEDANEPGKISFNKINASIYKITNDTIYKTETAFLELKSDALLMGKGRMSILLKGRIFDSHNTFSLNGTLSGLQANELNPILEKNVFIYATSGKIDKMNFSFLANNTKATGKMVMLYHGLNIAVKNKKTDDTIAFKERLISFIANRRVMDSNPVPGEAVRVGKIEYGRDPERFLFHYCFRSILSGISSSLAKSQNKKGHLAQKNP